MIKRSLKPGGVLFLSTLSTADPEHFSKGTPVETDAKPFVDEKFLDFSTREEIGTVFKLPEH